MLRPETLGSLVLFALASSITPGPNNIMLMASGLNHGFRKTIHHMLGICGGFFVLLLAVGLGLGRLLDMYPSLYQWLKACAGLYLIYFAWNMATANSHIKQKQQKRRPMSFIEAAAFQWINPKAWIMAVSAMVIYTDPMNPYASMLQVSLVFSLINLPCVSSWAAFGHWMQPLFQNPARMRRLNQFMAVLLVLCIIPILLPSYTP